MRKALLVGFTLLLLALVFASPVLEGRAEEDFVVYWSAARLLVAGENPYDHDMMEATMHAVQPERAWGRGVAWNLPWLLLLLAPLGALPFYFAVRIWLLMNMVLIAMTLYWQWRLLHGAIRHFALVLVAGFFFGATLSNLYMGQIVVLELMAMTLCLRFLTQKQDVWAGVALFFTTIKPHLAYFFLFLMLLWVLWRRRWGVLMGGTMAFCIALGISWLLVPAWLDTYIELMDEGALLRYYTATVGGVTRALWGIRGLRYVGVLLVPLAFPFLRLVDRHGWPVTLSLALVLSLPLAPYGFGFDQLLLLPAILLLLKWLLTRQLPHRRARWVLVGLSLIYAVFLWQLTLPSLPYYALTWVPFAVGALYGLVWRQSPLMTHRSTEVR